MGVMTGANHPIKPFVEMITISKNNFGFTPECAN
jgi:hypothetical protein